MSRFLDELKQQLAELQKDIEKLEKLEESKNWEMKCPFEDYDDCFIVDNNGFVYETHWRGLEGDFNCWKQGNTFLTEAEAELELKRRNLLTRFRAFRDECNGDWKHDWRRNTNKYLLYVRNKYVDITATDTSDYFTLFGYFKNLGDAQRAIELFGDEIIELFAEAE